MYKLYSNSAMLIQRCTTFKILAIVDYHVCTFPNHSFSFSIRSGTDQHLLRTPASLPFALAADISGTPSPPKAEPIRVAPKPKKQRRGSKKNVFFDDRGFPDQSDEYDTLLSTNDGGAILRKRKHPAPPLDKVDPQFFSPYDESKHGDHLRKQLPLFHLDASTRTAVHDLIKEFWSVFDDKGLFLPVKDYECSINTGHRITPADIGEEDHVRPS